MSVSGDGRIRTSYSFVSTWRLFSSESPFGTGGNLQNIPNGRTEEGRLIRSLFIPDNNRILVACDLSQAEARVVAWEAQDLAKMDAFLNPAMDVHWENAKMIFGFDLKHPYLPKEEIYSKVVNLSAPMKFFRNLGKTCVHAANYDMGPQMLQVILSREDVFMDFGTCKKLLLFYKSSNPFLGEWKRNIREKIQADRTLISSYGRKRQFLGRMNDELYRSAYAFSPQSTVGEVVEDGIMRIHSEVPECQILLNVHDEVVVQCLPQDKEVVMKKVKELMEIPIPIHGDILTIPAEFKVGLNWGEMKEEKI
jgi:DNA polymerase-1